MGWLFQRWVSCEDQVLETVQEFRFGHGGLGCLLGLQGEMSDVQLAVYSWNWG